MPTSTPYLVRIEHHTTRPKVISIGVRTDNKSGPGYPCNSDSDCFANACGRPSAAPGTQKICCSNGSETFAGYSYCKNMGLGTACRSNAMCASGYCYGNKDGFGTGQCSNRNALPFGSACTQNANCLTNNCALSWTDQSGVKHMTCQ